MTVKTKILLYLGLLLATSILTLTVLNYFSFKQASINNYTTNLDSRSLLISHALDQRMMRIFNTLEAAARTIQIDETGAVETQRLLTTLNAVKNSLNTINAYVAVRNGTTYSSSTAGIVPNFNAKEKQREWYIRGFNGEKVILTRPYTSAEGDAVMAAAVPIKVNDKVVGVLSSNLKINQITEFIDTLTKNNQLFVSNKDGYLIAAKYPQYLGKNLYQLRPSYKAYANEDKSSHSYDFNGTEYLVVANQLARFGWTVWAWDPWTNIKQASNQTLTTSILLAFISIGISLVIMYYLVLHVLYKPIGGEPRQIAKLVNIVSDGDLSQTIPATKNQIDKKSGILSAVITMVASLRNMVININAISDKLGLFSTQIAQSADEVINSSKSQMEQLEQVATAMTQMTVTVEEVARNAQQASTMVEQADEYAIKGSTIVALMGSDIDNFVNSMEQVQIVTSDLAQESVNIEQILDVIRAIAEQTNLLALNAAIEAARAGEQGRGFAVVADEVRNLANRTQQSTNEIQNMITRLQTEAQRSAELIKTNTKDAMNTATKSQEAVEVIAQIKNSISCIKDINYQIATATEQQTLTSKEINHSVVHINELAKNTYHCSQDNAASAKDILHTAKALNQSVATFKL